MKRFIPAIFLLFTVVFSQQETIPSSGTMDSLIIKTNGNFTELYEAPYASLYLSEPETLVVTAGTPLSVSKITVEASSGFTYLLNHLRFNKDYRAIIKVDGAISTTSTINNVITTVSFAKNDTISLGTQITRKIGTGADVGAVPVSGVFTLKNMDYLDFFIDSDVNTTLIIQKANFTIYLLQIL